MSENYITKEIMQENATALASVSDLSLTEARKKLDISIAITVDSADDTAFQIANEVMKMLRRTVSQVFITQLEKHVAAELVIGSAIPRTSGKKIYLSICHAKAIITQKPKSTEACKPIPDILALLIGCYASATSLHLALGDILPSNFQDPFVIHFDQFEIDWTSILNPIDLGHAYLAGAGAIGNGFLWAARHLDFCGQLDIVDDDQVSSGNLNRQMWFKSDDIGSSKSDCLKMRAQEFFPKLYLKPRRYRIQNLPEKSDNSWLRRLIVAVDSRRERRNLQNEFPREVFDASTTDIREVVIHYNIQPTKNACLSCIYEPTNKEISRERHIADHLGISVDDLQTQRISASTEHIIKRKFPALENDCLLNFSYDTLFKSLCAEGRLQTPAGRAIVAPFSFVSVFAGTLLALEMVRQLSTTQVTQDFNYWCISPWFPPNIRRRKIRQKQPNCEFCGSELFKEINETLWG